MTGNNYVDLDLYGRGFDGIFGYGAEHENKRQALMKFRAMQRFKARVKPGEYIDLDLYGRGDPRVFGKDAHIHTQKHARSHMEDVQRRKREGYVSPAVVMFPAGLKAITRKTRKLLKLASSKSFETSEAQPLAGENTKSGHEGATEDQEITYVDDTNEEKATVQELGITSNAPRRFKSRLPSEEVPPYVEPGVVARAVKSISSQDKTEDGYTVEPNRHTQIIESAQTRAHSSNVSRGVFPPESSRSADSSEDHNAETVSDSDQRRRLAEPVSTTNEAEVARGIIVGSDDEFPLSFSTRVRDDAQNDYNSTSSEEDLLARQPNQERVLVDTAGRTGSGGNKIAGLFRSSDSDSGSDQEDSSEGSRGAAGPSRTVDMYSSTEGEDEDMSTDESVSTDEDVSTDEGISADGNVPTDEAGEVIERSPSEIQNATALAEVDSRGEAQESAESEDPQPMLGIRESSIIQVVETSDLLIDTGLKDDNNNDIQEVVEARAAFGTTTPGEIVEENTGMYDVDEASAEVIEQAVQGSLSSDGSASGENVGVGDQEDNSMDSAENREDSDYVTDSDRSAEAASSSVVMSSSPEEDSDDIEVETSGEVEEESDETEEVEAEEPEEQEERSTAQVGADLTEDYSDVRVVDSSDAGITSNEDSNSGEDQEVTGAENENNDNEEAGIAQDENGEGKPFWQRLPFFGAIVQGSWTAY